MSADAPPRRQRLAAYAVLRRGEDVLLARIATRIHADLWTLPGGGVDHGEDPRSAAAREVYEESGLRVGVGRVLDVHSRHFTGARPDGRVEDFHGVGLIFEAVVLPEWRDVEPHVVEVDGTTREVAWVPLAKARGLPLSSTAAHALSELTSVQEERP
jgi:8-oxo-dGTP diphosphatase